MNSHVVQLVMRPHNHNQNHNVTIIMCDLMWVAAVAMQLTSKICENIVGLWGHLGQNGVNGRTG